MNITAEHCYTVYCSTIHDYHIEDKVDQVMHNPYPLTVIEHHLYRKNWIDTVQWHLEDLIRDPDIEPVNALKIKRRIDAYNQKRTDMVEEIDEYFEKQLMQIKPAAQVRHNSETPGWALDRLSILSLKEYHLEAELLRESITGQHRAKCLVRKKILMEQKTDLLQSINWLIEDLESGKIRMKSYKQLKMYNDPAFNPVLYQKEKQSS
jgi:hypothetical protein